MPADTNQAKTKTIETEGPKWLRFVPFAGTFFSLKAAFGLKFLFMICCTNHLVKGYSYGTSNLVRRNYFADMNTPAADIDRYLAIASVPWAVKPLLGLLSDCFPIMGYRRNPYIVLTTVIGIVGFSIVCFVPIGGGQTPLTATLGFFFGALHWATCDLMAETVYSRHISDNPDLGVQLVSYVWLGFMFCSLLGSICSGLIIDGVDSAGGVWGYTGTQWVMTTCLVPMVIVAAPSLMNFLGDKKVTSVEARGHRANMWNNERTFIVVGIAISVLSVAQSVAGLFVTNTINLVLILIVAVLSVGMAFGILRPVTGKFVLFSGISYTTAILSVSAAATYFFLNNEEQYPEGPHFTATFYYSVMGSLATLCQIVAIYLFNRFMRGFNYRAVYVIMLLMNLFMQLPTTMLYARWNVKVGIPDWAFALGDEALTGAFSILFQMPGFLLTSHVCPKNMEGTMFALVAAINNFCIGAAGPISGTVSEWWGVNPNGSPNESHQFDNMWKVSLVLAFGKLVPIVFLFLIPNKKMTAEILTEDQKKSATHGSPYERCTGAYKPSLGEEKSNPNSTLPEER